LKNCL